MYVRTTLKGLIFAAAMSVYSGQLALAAPVSGAKPGGTDVRVLEDAADPFVSAGPTTAPAVGEGQSVNASQVSVSDAGTVEIHVNEASLVEVLRMLSLQSQKNIIASKDVRGTVTANLYNVTVREALDALLHANGFAYREKGNFIFVYTAKELVEIEKSDRKRVTQVFRLCNINATDASKLIAPVLSKESVLALTPPASQGIPMGSNGNTGGDSHATSDLLVVTDYPDNIMAVKSVLKDADRKPAQVLIEATIISASLSDNNQLGVDFTALGGVDFATLNGSTGASGSLTKSALDGNIINTAGTGDITDAGYAAGQVGGNGLKMGIVTNNFSMFINALETVSHTNILANPKILVLNKQRGEVHVGREIGYRDQTTIDGSGKATVGQVSFLNVGTRLIFRPYVSEDGYIRMEVHPEESSGELVNDGQGGKIPNKSTTEITSNVIIKDGNTIVIGGLFREQDGISTSQTPGLGSLPIVGPLFRQQTDDRKRDEIIILLTPHIIKDDSVLAKGSEEALQFSEQIRVGMRKGMMCFGRERMAESNYDQAVKEMAKPLPDRQKALWYLNCATTMNPMFSEAISLKQSVSGKEITSVDNSFIRSFVRKQILLDKVTAPTSEPAPIPAGPTAPTGDIPAALPTTMPVTTAKPAVQIAAAAIQPTTKVPATQPLTEISPTTPASEDPAPQTVAEVPATQPVAQTLIIESVETATTTTEVPTTKPVAQTLIIETEEPVTTITELPVGEK